LVSGASAAVTAALTAEFTSMPGVDAPVAASRISLRLMELEDPSSEFNAEIELMDFVCSYKRIAITSCTSGLVPYLAHLYIGTLSFGFQEGRKKEVAPSERHHVEE
jgi:hypothetical protein